MYVLRCTYTPHVHPRHLLLFAACRLPDEGLKYYVRSLSLCETAEGWLGVAACLLLQQQQLQQQQVLLSERHQQLLLEQQIEKQQEPASAENEQELQQQQRQQERQHEQQQQELRQQQHRLLQQTLQAAAAANRLNPTRAEPWAYLCVSSLGLGRARQAAVSCRFFFKSTLRAENTLARHSIIVFNDPFLPLPPAVPDTAAAAAVAAAAEAATAAATDGREDTGAGSASPRAAAAAAGICCCWVGSLSLRLAAALLQYHQQQLQQPQQQPQPRELKAVETAKALVSLQTPADNGTAPTLALNPKPFSFSVNERLSECWDHDVGFAVEVFAQRAGSHAPLFQDCWQQKKRKS